MAEIAFPAAAKMRLLERACADRAAQREVNGASLTLLDIPVLVVLLSAVNRTTGITEISHEELALRAGCRPRAAGQSTNRLETFGYVSVIRKEIGYRSDMTPVYGGRTGKNCYQFIDSSSSGQTSIRPAVHLNDCSSKPKTPFGETQKIVSPDAIHYSSPSSLKVTLLPMDEQERGTGTELESHWATIKQEVSKHYGKNSNAGHAIETLVIGGFADGVVTLVAAGPFHARHVKEHYIDRIKSVWRGFDQAVREIRIETKRAAS
jgi:hypothetical protein